MAAVFLLLHESLPGQAGILKGIAYALLAWFLRVAMPTDLQWMMLRVPAATALYTLAAGFCETPALGALFVPAASSPCDTIRERSAPGDEQARRNGKRLSFPITQKEP